MTGRVVAIDLGSRRIGVALSDPARVLATPVAGIDRSTREADHDRIAEVVQEYSVELVLVGLPRSLDGALGNAARVILAEIDEIRDRVSVPVEEVDERFTTVIAHDRLAESGVGSRKRRAKVDSAAAAVMLQGWLDSRSASGAAQATTMEDSP